MLLGLGAFSLVVAAISLVAANWDNFDASARGTVLLVVTLAAIALARVVHDRGLVGTSTALASIAVCMTFVDLSAVKQAAFAMTSDDVYLAVGGGVLLVVLSLFHLLVPGVPVRLGWAAAWWLATWATLATWNVTGWDLYFLPLALLIVAASCLRARGNPTAGSWDRFGLGLLVGFGPAVLNSLVDPHLVRPLIVLTAATAVLLAGVVTRQRAPISVAALSVGGMIFGHLARVTGSIPGWVTLSVVGVLLLVAGATYERQRRRVDHIRSAMRTFR